MQINKEALKDHRGPGDASIPRAQDHQEKAGVHAKVYLEGALVHCDGAEYEKTKYSYLLPDRMADLFMQRDHKATPAERRCGLFCIALFFN
jgi:hypothetical protein